MSRCEEIKCFFLVSLNVCESFRLFVAETAREGEAPSEPGGAGQSCQRDQVSKNEELKFNNGSVDMKKLQRTTDKPFPIVPRLVAGGILTFFSLKHFGNPEHFANIMTAAGFPMVQLNVWAASATELLAGLLLLSGFFTRVGGFLGIATMIPAIIATLTINGLDPQNLPGGLTEVPFIPPLPLPIVTTVTSLVALIVGGGKFSVDKLMSGTKGASSEAE